MPTIDYRIAKKTPNIFLVQVEMNADSLERLAMQMGWLNPDFLKAVNNAEKDFENGKVREIVSSKDLED